MMTKNKKIIILSLIASVAIFFGIYFGIIRNNASSKLAEKFNQAQEIKNRYQLNQVSLILPAKDKNSVEVKLGEKDAQEFIPNLELSKWEGEVKMKIKPQIAQAAQQEKTLEFENEKINFKTAKEDYRFYDIASNQEHPEGAYEFEVILKEKPQSNVVSLDIETENLDFFYQPPLTQKEIDRGDIMPENVIGSYAVYYKGGVSGDFSKIGGKNYKTGKAFHIYRPKVIDASNNWVWGGLQIDEQAGKMTITVPQNFLDKAVYPVIVDPTFGYEGIGATVASLANVITCWVASSTNTGTADNIQAHLRESTEANAHQFKGALYASSTSALLTNGTTTERQDVSTTGSWVTFSFPTPPTVTNGTNYNICMWSGNAAGSPYVARDVTTPGGVTDSETYGTWPDPGTFVASDIRYSIYVNYTAGAICGDGTCNGSETCVSCSADCGTCIAVLRRDVILKRNVIFGRPTACSSPSCPTTCKMTATEAFEDGSNACYSSGPTTCINSWVSSSLYGTESISVVNSPAGASEGTSCTKSLQVYFPTDNNNNSVYAYWDNGAFIDLSTTNTNVVSYIYIDSASLTLAPFAAISLVHFDTQSNCNNSTPGNLLFRNGDGEYEFYISGSAVSGFLVITLNTWYLVTIHYDTTAANSYVSLAGDTACAGGAADTTTCKKFTRYAMNPRYLCIGAAYGSVTTAKAATIYYGYTYVSTP